MGDLDQQLRQLVVDACAHPPGHPIRQKNLTRLIRLVSGRLWRDSSPGYGDALQQTWIFFCQNLCEKTTGERYDPDRSSVITWLNYYLKRRLQDFQIDQQKQQSRTANPQVRTGHSGTEGVIDPLDTVAAEPDVPPILTQVQHWVETDRTGELRQVCIEGRSDVTCQMLLLRRLPPETSWKQLSEEFGLSVSTLSSFYQRQCLPRLRKFGESEGYL